MKMLIKFRKNIIPKGYEDYKEVLNQMHDLSQILRDNKIRRGFIDFEIDESKLLSMIKVRP